MHHPTRSSRGYRPVVPGGGAFHDDRPGPIRSPSRQGRRGAGQVFGEV